MENREQSGFKKQNLSSEDNLAEVVMGSQKLAKAKLDFIVYYLVAHIFAIPMFVVMVSIMNGNAAWSGFKFILALDLIAIVIFEIIIWTRVGSGEEIISARYPWISAILVSSVITVYLAFAMFD